MSRPLPPHFSLKRPKKAGKKFHTFHFPITLLLREIKPFFFATSFTDKSAPAKNEKFVILLCVRTVKTQRVTEKCFQTEAKVDVSQKSPTSSKTTKNVKNKTKQKENVKVFKKCQFFDYFQRTTSNCDFH